MTANITSVKAISTKTFTGEVIPAGGGDFIGKTIGIITGRVDGVFVKHTQFGENLGLSGEFLGVNPNTGEAFESSKLYLTQDKAAEIANALEKAEPGSTVSLGKLEITVAKSEKGSRGYSFIIRQMQTAEVHNLRREMLNELLNDIKALPAPEAKAETGKKKSA